MPTSRFYRAKAEGRGTYRLYDVSMQAEVQERQALANDIRTGMEAGRFRLHYQPQIDLASGSIVGVNISPIHFKSGKLADLIERILDQTEIPAERIELEITESSILDSQAVAQTLSQLEKLGVRLAIDDFGTGYSSQSYLKMFPAYLKMFPVHKLKIDQSFVRDVDSDKDSRAIVRLGHSLDLKVIAEGVETDEHAAFLRSLNCDEAQGYHYGRPVSAEQLGRLLATNVVL